MKKKLLAYLLVAVILVPLCCPRSASAAAVPSLNLYFENNIAHCKADCQGPGKIELNMVLWQSNTVVDSWVLTGNIYVSFHKTCDVLPGGTYTLMLSGTVGGVPIQEVRIIRTNYEMNK